MRKCLLQILLTSCALAISSLASSSDHIRSSGIPELVVQAPHFKSITSFDLSPNSSLLAAASIDHTVKLWDASTGMMLRTLVGHGGIVSDVQFSPDGQPLVSISNGLSEAEGEPDRTIRLWNVNTGMMVAVIHNDHFPAEYYDKHSNAISGAHWSPP